MHDISRTTPIRSRRDAFLTARNAMLIGRVVSVVQMVTA